MDFRELEYLLAIAKHQNITRAAEALYIGQPTLSKFLTGLEAELGIRLFDRVGRKYILTYAGSRYVEKAREILNLKSDIDREMAEILKNEKGVLNIAFANMRCTYMLPVTLPRFEAMYPNVQVNIFEGNSTENELRLLNGQVDVAFFSFADQHPQIDYTTLAKEELLICTGKGHPAALMAEKIPGQRYPHLNLASIQNDRVLLMQKSQRTRQIVDGIMKAQGLTFQNTMVTSSMPAIIGLVAAGFGVSILFESHLRYSPDRNRINCYSFGSPNTICDFVAATRKGRFLPACVGAYIDIVRNSL